MASNNEEVEKLIQEEGLTAPRLTEDDIKKKIKGVTYTVLPSGKCMICEITLDNGYTVRGEAACVSPANFNEKVGKKVSYDDAFDKIWPLEGYLLQEKHPVIDPMTTEEAMEEAVIRRS